MGYTSSFVMGMDYGGSQYLGGCRITPTDSRPCFSSDLSLPPLTPTLSHGGERENEVKNDYIEVRLVKWLEETFCDPIKVDGFARSHQRAPCGAPKSMTGR